MNKIIIALVLAIGLSGCFQTTNPDGSTTSGMRGSVMWITNAPIEYAVDYMKDTDTWRICEIWDETLSTDPYYLSVPKYSKSTGIKMRRVLAKTLESRGEDPMICRATSNNKNTVKTKRKSNVPEMDYLGADANAILRD